MHQPDCYAIVRIFLPVFREQQGISKPLECNQGSRLTTPDTFFVGSTRICAIEAVLVASLSGSSPRRSHKQLSGRTLTHAAPKLTLVALASFMGPQLHMGRRSTQMMVMGVLVVALLQGALTAQGV